MNKQVRRRWLRKEGLCVDDCGKVATINGNGEKSISAIRAEPHLLHRGDTLDRRK